MSCGKHNLCFLIRLRNLEIDRSCVRARPECRRSALECQKTAYVMTIVELSLPLVVVRYLLARVELGVDAILYLESLPVC